MTEDSENAPGTKLSDAEVSRFPHLLKRGIIFRRGCVIKNGNIAMFLRTILFPVCDESEISEIFEFLLGQRFLRGLREQVFVVHIGQQCCCCLLFHLVRFQGLFQLLGLHQGNLGLRFLKWKWNVVMLYRA